MEKEPSQKKTVGELVAAQYEAETRIKDTLESISPMLSRLKDIKIPSFSIPETHLLENYTPPEVTREQNAWERHNEMLDVHNAVLRVQQEILTEQRSNKKYVIVGLILSGLAAFFGLIAVIPVLPILKAWIEL